MLWPYDGTSPYGPAPMTGMTFMPPAPQPLVPPPPPCVGQFGPGGYPSGPLRAGDSDLSSSLQLRPTCSSAGGPTTGAISGKPAKPPQHVKKPLNAFMLFMKEMRPKVS